MAKQRFFWLRGTKADSPSITEHTSAETLADRIAGGPLPKAVALRYAIELAEILREVHNRGRAYAIFRPSLVTIVDDVFELAQHGPASISPYSSPEQILGRDLDTRTDIFALGVVIYEMIRGRKPFDASTSTALRTAILDQEPPPLENAPPALKRLVQRCLEKKRERRIQHIEILLAQLKLQEILDTTASQRIEG